MPFWKPKKKKKAVHKAKPAKSLPKYEPKPFIPPEIPKIDISANQQKGPQKPAPKKLPRQGLMTRSISLRHLTSSCPSEIDRGTFGRTSF